METIITLQFMTNIVILVIGYFLRRFIKQQDEYQTNTNDKIHEIEKNYLHRFDDIRDKITESERNIINKIMEYIK